MSIFITKFKIMSMRHYIPIYFGILISLFENIIWIPITITSIIYLYNDIRFGDFHIDFQNSYAVISILLLDSHYVILASSEQILRLIAHISLGCVGLAAFLKKRWLIVVAVILVHVIHNVANVSVIPQGIEPGDLPALKTMAVWGPVFHIAAIAALALVAYKSGVLQGFVRSSNPPTAQRAQSRGAKAS